MRPPLLPLLALERQVRALAAQLPGGPAALPTFGDAQNDGLPNIEVGETYDFVVRERGQELERRRTGDLDELLYWVFQSVTFSLACDWELAHREGAEDPRRQLFQHQRSLLNDLNPSWATRREAEFAAILKDYPFADADFERSNDADLAKAPADPELDLEMPLIPVDEPAPPWVALPDLSPDEPANQGAAEAYIVLTFMPYWTGLSADAKADYLARWDASPAWRAAIAEKYDHQGLDLEGDAREAEAWRLSAPRRSRKLRWMFWKP